MPKIVDHEKYRKELAGKATKIFTKYGYSGLGMRKIAEEMGISKSALYHYFPSKEVLFTECTKQVTAFEDQVSGNLDLDTMSQREKVNVLISIFKEIEKDFKGELSLLVDYIRTLTPTQIARDKNMKLANDRYLAMVAFYTGEKKAPVALCLMYGTLLQRLFDGRKTRFEEIEETLYLLVDK